MTDAGELLAWVHGGDRYATHVALDATRRRRSDRIVSRCSCPVGYGCKHAVAVILECLQAVEEATQVPVAREADPRLALIEGWIDEGDGDGSRGPRKSKTRKRTKETSASDIRRHLTSKSPDDLVNLLMRVHDRDPDFRRALVEECALAGGRFDELLSEARREMRSLTAEEAWQNPWTGDGHLPDYSGLEKRLRTLLEHGHADAIVELGEELLQRGTEQVELSRDEGEICCAIGECMQVVCEALLQSSRGDEAKIIFAIDLLFADEYGICDGFASVCDRRWKKATWSAVADRLRERLGDRETAPGGRDEWSLNYRRGRLSDWVITALDNAGRVDEATEFCVDEGRASDHYTRAVRRLLKVGEEERAAEMATEGLDAVSPQHRGIVRELQDLLSEIAVKNKNWLLPASVAADRFFSQPSVSGYRDLLEAAKKTEHAETIQKGALAFLESGKRPDLRGKGKSKRAVSSWPLPAPPRSSQVTDEGRPARSGPYFDILIELAIDERRPDDVLLWFDRRKAAGSSTFHRWLGQPRRDDARVAKGVEAAHPQRAIEIYLRLAQGVAAETKPKLYPEAGAHLKRVKSLLRKSGRGGDWSTIIGEFRSANHRKRRLMEVLDGIEGKPIVGRVR